MTLKELRESNDYKVFLEINKNEDDDDMFACFLTNTIQSERSYEECKDFLNKLRPGVEFLTITMYPKKMSVKRFSDMIRSVLRNFVENMENIKIDEQYVEKWFSTFEAWMDIDRKEK